MVCFIFLSYIRSVQAVAKKPWFPNQVEPSKNFVKKKEKDVVDKKTTNDKKVEVTGVDEVKNECKKRKEVKPEEQQAKKAKKKIKTENDSNGSEQKKNTTTNKKKKKNEPKQPKDSRFPMQLSSDEANWRKRMSFSAM